MTKTKRPVMCAILWILAIIWAILWLVGFFIAGWFSIFSANMNFEFIIRAYFALLFVWAILSVAMAVWFLKMKKWLPILVVSSLVLYTVQYLIIIFGWWANFKSWLIVIAIFAATTWYAYVNKKLFKN